MTLGLPSLRIKSLENNALAGRLLSVTVLFKAANLTFQSTEMIASQVEAIMLGFIIALIIFYLIRFIIYNERNFNVISIFMFCIYLSAYLYAYLRFNEIQGNILKRAIWTLVFGFICFICTIIITDTERIFNEIYRFSFFFTVLGTMIFLGDTGTLSSNMAFSYMMLFPFSIHVIRLISHRKNVLLWLLCFFEIGIIFVHGSRGGLLYSVSLVVVAVFINSKSVKQRVFKIIMAVLLCLIAIIVFLPNLGVVFNALESRGIYIRNLDFISRRSFLNSNGRKDIAGEYIEKILNGFPVRFSIVDSYNNGTNYPHNVFLEMIYDYGSALGIVVVTIYVFCVVKTFLSLRGSDKNLMLIFITSGLLPLLTSFTYFEWPLFWALLGFLFSFSKYASTKKRRLEHEASIHCQ